MILNTRFQQVFFDMAGDNINIPVFSTVCVSINLPGLWIYTLVYSFLMSDTVTQCSFDNL